MLFEFEFASSVLLVFFVNIFVFAVIYLYRGFANDTLSDKLLGIFLFFSSLFIIPWMTGFAGWYDQQPYRDILFYTPFMNGLMLGPLLYFYLRSITNYNFRFTFKTWIHFFPGLLYILWAFIIFLVDKVFVSDGRVMSKSLDPDVEEWYLYLWAFSILVYLIQSIRYYILYKKYAYLEFSFADAALFSWLRNFLVAFAILTLCTITLHLLSDIVQLGYWLMWYYVLFFSVIVYYIAIAGYRNTESVIPVRLLLFDPALLEQYKLKAITDTSGASDTNATKAQIEDAPPVLTEDPAHETSISQDIDTAEQEATKARLKEWSQKIEHALEHDKVFTDPGFSLEDLATRLKTNRAVLSAAINLNFGQNFNDYVNMYRVKEVIKAMADPSFSNFTLLSMAYDAGFNSKSTFNRAFKKHTGVSPKEYLEKIRKAS